jgi:hypothetical protein
MRGVPVWLASVSRWDGDKNIPTERWSESQLRSAKEVSHQVLSDVGNPDMERGFLMCSTLCVHRAVTPLESSSLPPGPGYLAGPPGVRVVWEGEKCPPISLSFTPCDKRTFMVMGQLKLPVDNCGACPSCLARTEIIRAINARLNER